LFAHLRPRDRSVFSCLAAALGAATGVYWMTVGGSFLDPLLVPPMLAGLLLLLREDAHAARRAALAGALFGAAAALKYSNAIYALAALPLAALRLRACFAYVLGGAAVIGLGALAARRGPPAVGGTDWRLFAFFAFALALWLASSANGRYGMVVLLLAGVCLARVVERLLPARAARLSLAVLLLVQLATTFIASPTRWFLAERWSRHWFPYAVPERA